MLCQERPWVVFLLAATLVIIWTFRLVDVPELLFGAGPNQHAEKIFLGQAMNVEFPTPFDYKPIQEVCARELPKSRPGLLFSCEGQHGGIGMLRNQMLKCIRYAIHAGGAVVVPSMALRNANSLAEIETSNLEPLDYLLDRATFVTRLSEGCPGIRIYERAEDFPFYERAGKPLALLGDQFEPDHPKGGLRHPSEWRRHFDEWLVQQHRRLRPDRPVHVQMQQSYLEYPVHDDGDAFAYEFGKILSFRNDTRALAAKIIWELKQRFALPIDPKKAINPNAFFGAHLRLEEDAVWAWSPDEWRFSRMKDQFEEQFRYLSQTGLRVVYVASGNQTVVDIFAQRLAMNITADPSAWKETNVTVVTKNDLLQGADRRRLDTLTFDQLALVDFLVMFKASAFMGVAHSAFSWNVALRRHELSKFKDYANEGSDLLRDEFSVIMGMEADYPRVDNFKYAIWP